jgi:hypothetical protein
MVCALVGSVATKYSVSNKIEINMLSLGVL